MDACPCKLYLRAHTHTCVISIQICEYIYIYIYIYIYLFRLSGSYYKYLCIDYKGNCQEIFRPLHYFDPLGEAKVLEGGVLPTRRARGAPDQMQKVWLRQGLEVRNQALWYIIIVQLQRQTVRKHVCNKFMRLLCY